jgi:hypothetical protein
MIKEKSRIAEGKIMYLQLKDNGVAREVVSGDLATAIFRQRRKSQMVAPPPRPNRIMAINKLRKGAISAQNRYAATPQTNGETG